MAKLTMLAVATMAAPPALEHALEALRARAIPAALVTLAFALLACRMRAVDQSGAIVGAAISFALYVSGGPAAFVVLATVFLLTAASTRLRYAHKQALGVAERKRGRNGWQVGANLAVAGGLCVAALPGSHHPSLWIAAIAVLAEATADTVSSECGQALAARVYLITNFERVPVGSDGAISLKGTLAGAAAALLVSIMSARMELMSRHWIPIVAGVAILGNFFDSLLGATLQRRGWLNNSTVNFLSTAVTAGIALLLAKS